MMVRDLIERALRLIGVLAVDETLPGEHAEVGLRAYNAMRAAWTLDGIEFYEADQDLHHTPPFGREYDEAAAHLLGARLAPEFGVRVTYDERNWLRRLQAHAVTIAEARMPTFRRWTRARV